MTRTRSLLLICLLTFGCLVASAASAQAVCKTWKGGNGNWGTASAWSPEGVPGSSDSVCIVAPATVVIPANGGVAKTLTVGGGSGEVTIDVVGESYDNAGNTSNETDLSVVENATFAANTKLILEATNATTNAKVEPHGAGGGLVGGSVVEAGQIEAVNKGAPWANRIKLANLQIEPGASLLNASGTLLFIKEGEGGYPWSVTNEGTFTVAAGALVEMQPSFSGKAGFINDATVVNDGSITTHGAEWTQQGGSVSGNEVVLQSGSTLADSAGAGSFLANNASFTLTGTIPAGQTVTVRGEPYNYGGELYNSTTLSTGGKELVNDGTLRLNPTGSGETGGSVSVESGSIHNNGLIVAETETPTRITQLLESLTNGPSGRLEVNGGVFQGNNGALTTNEGLVTVATRRPPSARGGSVVRQHGRWDVLTADRQRLGLRCCPADRPLLQRAGRVRSGRRPRAGARRRLCAIRGAGVRPLRARRRQVRKRLRGSRQRLHRRLLAQDLRTRVCRCCLRRVGRRWPRWWLGPEAKAPGRPRRLDLPQAGQAHRDALLPGRRRHVSGRERSGHRHRASEGWQDHRGHRAQGQEESGGEEEASGDRDRQRNAGSRAPPRRLRSHSTEPATRC